MEIKKIEHSIKVYAAASILLIVAYYLLDLDIFDSWTKYLPFMKKLTMSLFLIALIFLISNIFSRFINIQTQIQGERYNLLRINRFLAILFSLIVAASFLFQTHAAALVLV